MKRADDTPQNKILLGIGLDNTDGETRITRGKNFALVGGSEQTHAVMQETAVKVNEQLTKRGETLESVPKEELTDILREVSDKIGK